MCRILEKDFYRIARLLSKFLMGWQWKLVYSSTAGKCYWIRRDPHPLYEKVIDWV